MLKKVTLLGLGLLLAFPVIVDAQDQRQQRERRGPGPGQRVERPGGPGAGLGILLRMTESEVDQLVAVVNEYRPQFAQLQERAAAADTREARMEVRREQGQLMQEFQGKLTELGLVQERPARPRGEGRPGARRGGRDEG